MRIACRPYAVVLLAFNICLCIGFGTAVVPMQLGPLTGPLFHPGINIVRAWSFYSFIFGVSAFSIAVAIRKHPRASLLLFIVCLVIWYGSAGLFICLLG
jgi:hypothetical protein